jgi:ABC-type bacteriocin/lantibiotic exporter with double-glycine peptidase domain
MLLLNWLWARPVSSRGGLYFAKRVELPVPIFAQGDPRWKDDLLGPTEATLHAEGCAVASAAMVLASYGIDTDPGRLNAFVTQHKQGYTPEGWIYWEAAADFTPGIVEKAYEDAPSSARIDWNLLRGNPVIVRIKMPTNNHFVVIAGKDGFDYLVRDPGGGASRGLFPLRELAPRIEALRYYRRLTPSTPPAEALPN